ncbi:helix-turn-helix domain-containing protein [Listeria innocua]|uniref:helix-turn-helix domain-containing protein n=1 Tax=Listeria innocua TaxID=1642 RepID=UPI0021AB28A4|nr:helix-turn-helix domain-containing protein [Listeria innocua]
MKNSKGVLPFSVILLTINGDVSAVSKVLRHFEHYIIKLSQKTVFDEMGNPYIHVEPETKRTLKKSSL